MVLDLTHIFRQLLAAEDVEVKVLYRLTAVLTDIGDNSVAVLESKLLRNLRNNREDVCYHSGVIAVYIVCRGDMLLGHNESVHRCLGRNVEEGVAYIVLVNLL